MIEVKIEDREVRRLLSKLEKKAGDPTPAMRDIGEIVRRSVRRNFKEEGRPGKWEKSKRGGQTLTDTGRLKNSFTVKADRASVTVGTNVKYAPAQHFGTRPRKIVPRKKKALLIPGIGYRKSVNHPGLPARPFMMVQDEDWSKIKRAITRHLMEG